MVKKNFSEGEIVWAKLDDFPYWPSRIASENVTKQLKEFKEQDGVAVIFLGTQLLFGLIEEKNIKDFNDHLEEYKKAKISKVEQESFKKALEMALSKEDFVEPPLELYEEDRPMKKHKKSDSKEAEKKQVKHEEKTEDKESSKNESNVILEKNEDNLKNKNLNENTSKDKKVDSEIDQTVETEKSKPILSNTEDEKETNLVESKENVLDDKSKNPTESETAVEK